MTSRWTLVLVMATGLGALCNAAAAGSVKIIGLVELTGAGAPSGINFDNGIKLAVKEINASGGILGRTIDYQAKDTQSNPGVAKGLAEQAAEAEAYAVLGPIFSGSVLVSMPATRKAEIPNFTGGEAASITQQGNPYIFRTSIAQAKSMPRAVNYIKHKLGARTIDYVYANNDFGRTGREELLRSLATQGVHIGIDLAVDPGRVSYADIVRKARQGQGDLLFIYLNETEAARMLRELHKQGYGKPIFGENVLASQRVIEMAGDAAEGVMAHMGLTADAPNPLIQAYAQRFQKEFKSRSDHNGIKGYVAVYTVKAITEKVGRFDRKAFAQAMKNVTLTSQMHPGVLMDVTYDDKGDMDRESYVVRVVNGRQEVLKTYAPAVNPTSPHSSPRSLSTSDTRP